ncbi:MAG: hypothetical protein K1X94_30245 [Sandaracinaceae bacterium]|nr:hypothetical protein [Sandaracinaceae bacterium]
MSEKEEANITALDAPFVVRVAAAFQAVSGLYLVLSAAQLLSSIRFFGELQLMQYTNWAFVPLAVLQVVSAAQVVRVRPPWGVIGTVLSALIALAVTAWIAANVYFTIFSCMQLGTLVFAWIAAILAPFTIGPIARAGRARKALEEQGMDLGL